MVDQILYVFGPQKTRIDQAYALALATKIHSDPDLSFLLDAVSNLPSLSAEITASCSTLAHVSNFVDGQLDLLSNIICNCKPWKTQDLSAAFCVPFTVVLQAVEYIQSNPRPGHVQGFCVGFLTACAVTSSLNTSELSSAITKALNLAVLIGAAIDADASSPPAQTFSVAWKSDAQRRSLEDILTRLPGAYLSCLTDLDRVSVTVPAQDLAAFHDAALDSALSVIPLGLLGRFHQQGRDATTLAQLKELIKTRDDLKLPDVSRLTRPLRSNIDAKAIRPGTGTLSNTSLESRLVHQSRWYDVAKATVADLMGTPARVVQIGGSGIWPRSLFSQTISLADDSKTNQGITGPQHHNPDSRIEPIAVIGTACRFPRSKSVADFWRLISSGNCAVETLPEGRFDVESLEREPKGQFWGAFLNDADLFDQKFFGCSPREAKSMDPQQRLALQVAFETLEASGSAAMKDNLGKNVGCYLGVGSVDYEANVASDHANAFSATGTLRAFISGKISHHFGWTGPSITFDTACSSSAVAIHSACKALQHGECSMALAGGVNLITAPSLYQNLAAASFLNSRGASRAFDEDANGYCRGEGSGMVLLKPLKAAIADNDSIIGVIGGSAVNQGSNCSPITVPSADSQSALYEKILLESGLDASAVSFIEAHGTGTPVGDPIEAESIRGTFGGAHRPTSLSFGSVKDNIGHAEAASGAAGLIKVLMMMHHRTIPKQANFSKLNPSIPPLAPDRMSVPTKTHSWSDSQLAAVVNNYGAAGSNAALLVQEPSTSSIPQHIPEGSSLPITLSARTASSLQMYARVLADRLRGDLATSSLVDVAFNLAQRRNEDFQYSCSFTASDHQSMLGKLDDLASDSNVISKLTDKPPPSILCFGGQTGKTAYVAKEVYQTSPTFRGYLDQCGKELGQSLYPAILDSGEVEDIETMHCRLFSIQYASAKSWIDSGVEPSALIGHSFGQITALCVGGAISLSDALTLVAGRARLIRDNWSNERGVMLSVEGTLSDVERLIALAAENDPAATAEIVCYNGEKSYVIGGSSAAVTVIEQTHAASKSPLASLKLKRLENSHAFHSRLSEAILPGLRHLAEGITFSSPKIHVETCSEGASWASVGVDKIVEHTRLPVHFQAAVERLVDRLGENNVWLEAGTSTPIIPMVRRIVKDQAAFFKSDLSTSSSIDGLANIACALGNLGLASAFWPFHRSAVRSFKWLPLPPYQFETQRHWIDYKPPHTSKEPDLSPTRAPDDLIYKGDANGTFKINANHPFFQLGVKGHAVLGEPLCPASMYCELAVRAADLARPRSEKLPFKIEDLRIQSPLALTPTGSLLMKLTPVAAQDSWQFSIFTDSASNVHATGTLVHEANDQSEPDFKSLEILVGTPKHEQITSALHSETLSGKIVYSVFGKTVNYAQYYRGVKRVVAHETEVLGEVLVPQGQPEALTSSVCGVVALDNFLQVAGIHVNCLKECQDDEVYVCTGIQTIRSRSCFPDLVKQQLPWLVYSNFRETGKGKIVNDIYVLDATTKDLALVFRGAQFTSVSLQGLAKVLSRMNLSSSSTRTSSDTRVAKPAPMTVMPNVLTPPVSDDAESPIERSAEDNESVLLRVRSVLSEVLEIALDEVTASSNLMDLGIDSLMGNDVSVAIRKSFDIDIPAAELANIADVRALCDRLSPFAPTEDATSRSSPESVHADARDSTPQVPAETRSLKPQDVQHSDDGGVSTAAANLMAMSRSDYDLVMDQAGLVGFSDKVYPLQAELVIAYIAEAFEALGCNLRTMPAGTTLPKLPIAAQHSKAVHQYHMALRDGGFVTESTATSTYSRTEKPITTQPSTSLLEKILQLYPKHASEHKLLHTTGAHLAACLTGAKDPISLIFKDAKARDLLQDVYTNAPMFKAGTLFLAQYLVNVLDKADISRPIRILELGAGTGGTTSYLLSQLAGSRQPFKYMFTDLSPSLVASAKKKFANHKFMEYGVIDIEKTPSSEFQQSFDIVISTNCIHATRNLVTSCTNIRQVLREDGILCLVELNQNLYWFDLVFGLLEGWWLFNDGRSHALATPSFWQRSLTTAGFNWVDWTQGRMPETNILRVIAASPTPHEVKPAVTKETVTFAHADAVPLQADIYYPPKLDQAQSPRPVALLIHGGGHVMLSRRDVRREQVAHLLRAGFLPISMDYRLCPETTLRDGPMTDVATALVWIRADLPTLPLARADVQVDARTVVAVGWSTGGTLALSLAWTAPDPPSAILAFYCPTDYEDDVWRRPNVPVGSRPATLSARQLLEGVAERPLTAWNPRRELHAKGGWLAEADARSRLALWMNWEGRALHVLLRGLRPGDAGGDAVDAEGRLQLEEPAVEDVQAVSPLAQARAGQFRTPTFVVHGTADDLIPFGQSERFVAALQGAGVEATCRVVEGAIHLFDVEPEWEAADGNAAAAVWEGYDFLSKVAMAKN